MTYSTELELNNDLQYLFCFLTILRIKLANIERDYLAAIGCLLALYVPNCLKKAKEKIKKKGFSILSDTFNYYFKF